VGATAAGLTTALLRLIRAGCRAISAPPIALGVAMAAGRASTACIIGCMQALDSATK